MTGTDPKSKILDVEGHSNTYVYYLQTSFPSCFFHNKSIWNNRYQKEGAQIVNYYISAINEIHVKIIPVFKIHYECFWYGIEWGPWNGI